MARHLFLSSLIVCALGSGAIACTSTVMGTGTPPNEKGATNDPTKTEEPTEPSAGNADRSSDKLAARDALTHAVVG